jgi:hypothetical protein
VLELLGDAGAAEMAAHKLHRGTLLFGGAREPAPGPEAGPSAMAARLPPFYPLEGELSGGSYPLDEAAFRALPLRDQAAMVERQAAWRARAPGAERHFGLGFDLVENAAYGGAAGAMPLLVDALEPAGPAARAGVGAGMQLCTIDGVLVSARGADAARTLLAERVAQALASRAGRTGARLATFRAMPWEVLQRVQVPPPLSRTKWTRLVPPPY